MAPPTALERDIREKEEEEYDENADEDFNPEHAAAEEEASSSEDEEAVAAKSAKDTKKRKTELIEELDSGDEATIKERKRKRRKRDNTATAVVEDEQSGGEGGFVRTRAQRHAEVVERKERKIKTVGEVTIDVEEIWAALNSVSVGRPPPPPALVELVEVRDHQNKENAPAREEEFITITRRIEYAGDVTEVEESVLRTSKAARQYLEEHPEADPDYHPPPSQANAQLQRPLRRPSMFEPNPTASVKGVPPERLRLRAPSRIDVLMAEKRDELEGKKKAEKMTTVQKSALDWQGYVDQQGLRGELDEYGKSKGGYLAREDFLGRAELAHEQAARVARARG